MQCSLLYSLGCSSVVRVNWFRVFLYSLYGVGLRENDSSLSLNSNKDLFL